MVYNKAYYMQVLEGRSKRLNELLEISAPMNIISREVKLIVKITALINPVSFNTWRLWTQGNEDEDKVERRKCATG
jgi:hypothetical protein